MFAVGSAAGHLSDLHKPANTRDGFDRRGRQRFACHPCPRDFAHASSGAFSGFRWPPEVIVTAVRWYLSYPHSARQVWGSKITSNSAPHLEARVSDR